jgi:hypothetical protein
VFLLTVFLLLVFLLTVLLLTALLLTVFLLTVFLLLVFLLTVFLLTVLLGLPPVFLSSFAFAFPPGSPVSGVPLWRMVFAAYKYHYQIRKGIWMGTYVD